MKLTYFDLMTTTSAFRKIFELQLDFKTGLSLIKLMDKLEQEEMVWHKLLAKLPKEKGILTQAEILDKAKAQSFEIEIPPELTMDFIKKHDKELKLSVGELYCLSKIIDFK